MRQRGGPIAAAGQGSTPTSLTVLLPTRSLLLLGADQPAGAPKRDEELVWEGAAGGEEWGRGRGGGVGSGGCVCRCRRGGRRGKWGGGGGGMGRRGVGLGEDGACGGGREGGEGRGGAGRVRESPRDAYYRSSCLVEVTGRFIREGSWGGREGGGDCQGCAGRRKLFRIFGEVDEDRLGAERLGSGPSAPGGILGEEGRGKEEPG